MIPPPITTIFLGTCLRDLSTENVSPSYHVDMVKHQERTSSRLGISNKFHAANLQSASAGDDSLLVDLQAREWCRLATSSNDNVLTAQSALAAVDQVDLNFILVNEGAGTLNVVDAIFPI